MPTSSTGILSSSPPRQRQIEQSLERAPLTDVPCVELKENGETLMMGRSSNSSHFQLSSSRLISRVHVKARYIAALNPLDPNRIEIVCNGWNGVVLHSQGRSWTLWKDDTFSSETEGAEIMVDVHGARAMIQWPRRSEAHQSDSSWEDSPPRTAIYLQSSPLRRSTRVGSPESPTANLASSRRLQALLPSPGGNGIEIYEDDAELELPEPRREPAVDANASIRSEATASFTSELSEPEEEEDPNEENDPLVHSFGPFGADISGRLASITTKSPKPCQPARRALNSTTFEPLVPREMPSYPPSSPRKHYRSDSPLSSPPPTTESSTPEPVKSIEVNPAIPNHVINQLAYSRLSSTPLSTIMQNLPSEEKKGLTKEALREVIESTVCIGTIERQGKDAAGKPLESEYYYVPEKDDDDQRRAAVVDGLRKPSLRACRKQHKVRYMGSNSNNINTHFFFLAILLETSSNSLETSHPHFAATP